MFMCVPVPVPVCGMHVLPEVSLGCPPPSLITVSFLGRALTFTWMSLVQLDRLASQPEDPPSSASSVLRSQVHTTRPGLFHEGFGN